MSRFNIIATEPEKLNSYTFKIALPLNPLYLRFFPISNQLGSGRGSLEVWKFGSLEVWKFGSLEVKEFFR
jgi:hypothetical protein